MTYIVIGECLWFWNNKNASDNSYSISLYVEKHAERLRAKFLHLIHEIGQTKVGHVSLVEYLECHLGPSFWWMSKLNEKSFYKSVRITDSLKLLALEEILLEQSPFNIEFHGEDALIGHSIKQLCTSLGVHFDWDQKIHSKLRHYFIYYQECFFRPIKTIYHFICYLLKHRKLRAKKQKHWFDGELTTFFCSYFDNMDEMSFKKGLFNSHYWSELPNLLTDSKLKQNWLHIFAPSQMISNTKTALEGMQQFQKNANQPFVHAFL